MTIAALSLTLLALAPELPVLTRYLEHVGATRRFEAEGGRAALYVTPHAGRWSWALRSEGRAPVLGALPALRRPCDFLVDPAGRWFVALAGSWPDHDRRALARGPLKVDPDGRWFLVESDACGPVGHRCPRGTSCGWDPWIPGTWSSGAWLDAERRLLMVLRAACGPDPLRVVDLDTGSVRAGTEDDVARALARADARTARGALDAAREGSYLALAPWALAWVDDDDPEVRVAALGLRLAAGDPTARAALERVVTESIELHGFAHESAVLVLLEDGLDAEGFLALTGSDGRTPLAKEIRVRGEIAVFSEGDDPCADALWTLAWEHACERSEGARTVLGEVLWRLPPTRAGCLVGALLGLSESSQRAYLARCGLSPASLEGVQR
jgi:hypothetical protein